MLKFDYERNKYFKNNEVTLRAYYFQGLKRFKRALGQ